MMKDLFSLEGRIAVVTGGSRGIGKMIAQGFVEQGAKVYITARKAEACNETAAELSKLGDCISLPYDISTVDACREFAAEVTKQDGAIDILEGHGFGLPGADVPPPRSGGRPGPE